MTVDMIRSPCSCGPATDGTDFTDAQSARKARLKQTARSAECLSASIGRAGIDGAAINVAGVPTCSARRKQTSRFARFLPAGMGLAGIAGAAGAAKANRPVRQLLRAGAIVAAV